MVNNDTENSFLNVLYQNGGFYTAFNEKGERVGPLVGYAGRYKDKSGSDCQYVGDVYANCAQIEKDTFSLRLLIQESKEKITDHLFSSNMASVLSTRTSNRVIWLGAPMGGIVTATLLSFTVFPERSWCGFLEKKVIELAKDSREKTELVIGRHNINEGDVVVPVEDVCNNFSTTDKMLNLISGKQGRIPFIFCLINRSGKKSYLFEDKEIPIVSIVESNWPEYQQDDPRIKDYISIPGNLILNPKQNWDKLMSDMANRE